MVTITYEMGTGGRIRTINCASVVVGPDSIERFNKAEELLGTISKRFVIAVEYEEEKSA